jgi:hypothetical protein
MMMVADQSASMVVGLTVIVGPGIASAGGAAARGVILGVKEGVAEHRIGGEGVARGAGLV